MKLLKRTGIILVISTLAFEALLVFTGNTYVNKVLAMTIFSGKMGPDIDELELFNKHEVANGEVQPWPLSSRYNKGKISNELLSQIEAYQSVAFLVVQNDSLLHEQYWKGYNEHSVANSFSMAKSITSMLIGCALKDGLIHDINDPVGNYLDTFKEGNKAKITIKHLLTMSSGLDFKEEYVSPLAWPAEAYYGPDVNALTLRAPVKDEPGKIWHYKGGDSQLLGMILKRVTGKSIAEYASEKLWKPLGAEGKAFWSTDEQDMEKVSCCWYSNARDFAKLASLMLHGGKHQQVQLIDSAYVAASIKPAALVDRDGKPNRKYGYQWWLMEHKGHSIFYMRGIRGQYVFAIPDLNMVVVRYGHKRAPKAGDELPEDIFIYLDAAMGL